MKARQIQRKGCRRLGERCIGGRERETQVSWRERRSRERGGDGWVACFFWEAIGREKSRGKKMSRDQWGLAGCELHPSLQQLGVRQIFKRKREEGTIRRKRTEHQLSGKFRGNGRGRWVLRLELLQVHIQYAEVGDCSGRKTGGRLKPCSTEVAKKREAGAAERGSDC